MAYKILLYSDFYSEYEIVLTNIPREKLNYFIFIYINWNDLKIDFPEVIKASGYNFKLLKTSDQMFKNEINDYLIKDSNKLFVNDFYYDI